MTRAGRLSKTISQGSSARLSAGIWPMARPMTLPISIATTKDAVDPPQGDAKLGQEVAMNALLVDIFEHRGRVPEGAGSARTRRR